MTDAEWVNTNDDTSMLWESDYLWCKTPVRKYRLFAVACCRRIWELMPDERCRQAVTRLESFADGLATITFETQGEFFRGENLHEGLTPSQRSALSAAITCVADDDYRLASEVADYCRCAAAYRGHANSIDRSSQSLEETAQCDLIRDLFPTPTRSVTLHPAWRTSTVLALARQMYDARDFTPMPVLADALQDAGCDNADVLGHCRGDGPHVRGCWVVDLILGKS